MKILRAFLLVILFIIALFLVNKSASENQKDLKNLSFDELKIYFTRLSEKKGAKQAFEVLKKAAVAPNIDMHLLGHIVGDVLYKQQGAKGIQICTQDFRNACSHSIVVGLFTDKGEQALDEIKKACKDAPGGIGAYIMCYHGLGHGILAFEGYDFEKTIDLCKKTATEEYDSREYPECVSGAVMEIISGGGHDKNLWAQKRAQYLKSSDPLHICSKEFMPEEARGRCYDYLTPFLWEAVGADINNPAESDSQKSFKLCNQVDEEDYRQICFGGFGKEFVGLAQSKDIRRVDQIKSVKLKKIIDWCDLAEEKAGTDRCLASALSSIFWGGENGYKASIRFCSMISRPENFQACFLNLIGQVEYYIKDVKTKKSFCNDIPVQFAEECRKKLT